MSSITKLVVASSLLSTCVFACAFQSETGGPNAVDPQTLQHVVADNDQTESEPLAGEAPAPTAVEARQAATCSPPSGQSLQVCSSDHFDSSHRSLAYILSRASFDKGCGVQFDAMFPVAGTCGTADYAGSSTHWNKLYGVGQFGGGFFGRYQYSSLRLGWRYRPETSLFELSPYLHDGCNTDNGCGIYLENPQGHIAAADGSMAPVQVQPNTWISVDLVYKGSSYEARIGNHSFTGRFEHQNRRDAQIFDTLYFGGVPSAPKDVQVYLRNVRTRTSC